MKVKVILKEDIKGVGKKDDIIEVKDGYANNFLLKNNKGVLATPENIKKLQDKKDKKIRIHDTELKNAKELKELLETKVIAIKIKAGANGKIFGSIGSKEISDIIKAEFNVDVDKKKIGNVNRVKEIGQHIIEVKLFEDIKANIKLNVLEDK